MERVVCKFPKQWFIFPKVNLKKKPLRIKLSELKALLFGPENVSLVKLLELITRERERERERTCYSKLSEKRKQVGDVKSAQKNLMRR